MPKRSVAQALRREGGAAPRACLAEDDGQGQVTYHERFLTATQSRNAFRVLTELGKGVLKEEEVKRGGKVFRVGRKTAHFGDEGVTYAYAGKRRVVRDWDNKSKMGRFVKYLCGIVNKKLDTQFNYALVNVFAPKDQLGAHSDNEADIVPNTSIAAVSLGAERDIVFRNKSDGKPILTLCPAAGSLYVMEPPLQTFKTHAVPRRARAAGNRMSITFRRLAKRA